MTASGKIDNLNRLITSNEIESVTKTLLTNKIPEPGGFTGECKKSSIKYYQTEFNNNV